MAFGTALAGGALLLAIIAVLPVVLFLIAHWRIGTALHRIADSRAGSRVEADAALATPTPRLSTRQRWGPILVVLAAAAAVTIAILVLFGFG